MSSIDERVVAMKFQNSQFESGIKKTTDSLDTLKKGLNLDGAKKGLDDLNEAGKRFSLAGIADGVQGIASKFSALGIIGITALTNIANKAIDTGLTMVRSLTVDPIKAGLDEYELKMGSIQTILANTARFGTTLPQVTHALDELNTYADKTIYDFGQMTSNIGLFTNAGINIDDATSMIKGFSNAAAASGTNAQGAASAAYQLSQALSAGQIRLMDWRSLTNVGMGNKNMQDGLIQIADAMGTVNKSGLKAKDIQKDFNASLEKGWLTADVMSKYLKIMAGDMDVASMKALGLSDAEISNFQQQQKTAEEAATKVRTFTQLVGTMREAVGSSWTDTFDIIIGDFNQATDLWTGVNNTLGAMISASGDARNNLLRDWKKLGGRDAAIQAVTNAFEALMSIMKPIHEAFREIFPPITGQQLYNITKAIRDFLGTLKLTGPAAEQVKRTFKGIFAILDIGWQIIQQLVVVFAHLFGAIAPAGGSLLDITARIGDFLVKVDTAVKQGDGFINFFKTLEKILLLPIAGLKLLGQWIANIFSGFNGIDLAPLDHAFETIASRFDPLAAVGETIVNIWNGMLKAFQAVWNFFQPLATAIGNFFGNLGAQIANSMQTLNFSGILDIINTGLLGGIALMITKFFKKGLNIDFGGGFLNGLKDAFGALTDTLGAMQTKLKADALMRIAQAIGIMAAAVIGLSLIDSGRAAASIGLMTAMFVQLIAVLVTLSKLDFKSIGKIAVLAFAMIAVGASMAIASVGIMLMAAALKIMSTLSWEEIGRGLTAVAGSLIILAIGLTAMDASLPGAAALVIASVALIALGTALKIMATLSWDDIGRGMATMGASLAILAVGLTLMDAALPGAAALVVASVGLIALGVALQIMSTLTWDEIGRGMATLASSLGILAVGLTLMMVALPGAAALVVAAGGLVILGGALKIMGTLTWDEIGRGMTALAGALGILAIGLTLMIVALPGAAALVVAATALTILAPVLAFLGNLSWSVIGTGLGAMAAALGILAVAGILLLPAIPGLMGLGVAILLIGTGVFLAAVGLTAFAVAFTALAAAAAVGGVAIVALVSSLIGLIPLAIAKVGEGIVLFAGVISNAAPVFLNAMVVLITTLLTAINTVAPQIVNTLWLLIQLLVNTLVVAIPFFVDAGYKIIVGVLNGIANNIRGVVDAGSRIIVNLLNGIAANLPDIIRAGGNVVLSFINGLGDYIRNNSGQFVNAGSKLFRAIVDGVSSAIERGGSDLRWAGARIGNALINGAKNALGINSPSKVFRDYIMGSVFEGIEKGNKNNLTRADAAGTDIGNMMIGAVSKSISSIQDAVAMDLDMAPAIRPVLDLSAIKKDAGQISSTLGTPTLTLDKNINAAANVASQYSAVHSPDDSQNGSNGSAPTVINQTFNQTNTSPKALSAAEIYRNTKSQLSAAKEALTPNANQS